MKEIFIFIAFIFGNISLIFAQDNWGEQGGYSGSSISGIALSMITSRTNPIKNRKIKEIEFFIFQILILTIKRKKSGSKF